MSDGEEKARAANKVVEDQITASSSRSESKKPPGLRRVAMVCYYVHYDVPLKRKDT